MGKFTETPQVLQRVVLHPYVPSMVEKYHSWMQDDELLELTGSERLTLAEELENQQSWWIDPSKYTFIILSAQHSDPAHPEQSMIGDINLFLLGDGVGEISVMIAEKDYRGRGLAGECVRHMLQLAQQHLHISSFIAKIQADNAPSIRLFSTLGFTELTRIPEFNEVHYTLSLA